MNFDFTERPLWTLVGDGYVCLLDPLWVETDAPVAGRPPYVKTLRQIGAPPGRGDLDERGYQLTQAMPGLGVYVGNGRAEGRSSLALDWHIDVDVHCFSGAIGQGEQVRQDRERASRWLTQHVVEQLHMRVLPGDLDGDGIEGIEVVAVEHTATTATVDWRVVRTVVAVRQDIRRQRTPQVETAEFQQFGQPKREPVHTHIVEVDATASSTERSH